MLRSLVAIDHNDANVIGAHVRVNDIFRNDVDPRRIPPLIFAYPYIAAVRGFASLLRHHALTLRAEVRRKRTSRDANRRSSLVSHSHTTSTRQSLAFSLARWLASRATFL